MVRDDKRVRLCSGKSSIESGEIGPIDNLTRL